MRHPRTFGLLRQRFMDGWASVCHKHRSSHPPGSVVAGRSKSWLVMGSLVAVSVWLAPPVGWEGQVLWARGEIPAVQFDVSGSVACRDVTPDDFAERNSDERLVEARFQVSTFFGSGDPDELLQFLYTLDSPRKTVRIVDYEPKTTLESDVAGNVGIEKKKEKTFTLGLGLSGNAQHLIHADASGNAATKTLNSVKYDLLPPKELLAASGTLLRGHGVYFKLRPSEQTTLEGAKEFVVVLRVPRDWQADYVHLHCQATAHRRGGLQSSSDGITCGEASFVLALYLEGDDAARRTAEYFVQRDMQLRRGIRLHHDEIRKRAYPSLAHKIGGFFEVVAPEIPADWYRDVIYGGASRSEPSYIRQLPPEVADAARQYLASKRALHEMAGTSPMSTRQVARQ
jgi:hypothetical protein